MRPVGVVADRATLINSLAFSGRILGDQFVHKRLGNPESWSQPTEPRQTSDPRVGQSRQLAVHRRFRCSGFPAGRPRVFRRLRRSVEGPWLTTAPTGSHTSLPRPEVTGLDRWKGVQIELLPSPEASSPIRSLGDGAPSSFNSFSTSGGMIILLYNLRPKIYRFDDNQVVQG
jgi:hypothetical protein